MTDRAKKKPVINLLLAVPWFDVGGSSVLMAELFKRLSKQGVVVTAVATAPLGHVGADAGKTLYRSFAKKIVSLQHISNPKDAVFALAEIVISQRIDIIMIVGSTMMYGAIASLRKLNPDLRVVDQLYNPIGHVRSNKAYRKHIDFNLVASQEVKKKLMAMGERAKRIEVLHHGIDVQKFRPDSPLFLRRRAQRVARGFTFGFLGRLSSEKRPQDFVRLARALPRSRFILAGNGPLRAKIQMFAAKGRTSVKNLQQVGFVKHSMDLYGEIDAFVLTSEIEGLPITLLEAMALGIPVISTNVGGIPDLVKDGSNGFLVSPGKPGQLIARARKMVDKSSSDFNKFRVSARQSVEANFSIAKCADSYLNAFHRIIYGGL